MDCHGIQLEFVVGSQMEIARNIVDQQHDLLEMLSLLA